MPYKNKEDARRNKKKYAEEHKEEIKIRSQKNYKEHKEEKKKYREEHKEELNKYGRNYYKEHKDEAKEYSKKYREENKNEIKRKQKEKLLNMSPEDQEEYKETQNKYQRERNFKNKIKAYNIIGSNKLECSLCNNSIFKNLTIDHIDNCGGKERKDGLKTSSLNQKIVSGKYPEEKLKNLRLLCWNCNLARSREYLNFPKEKQSTGQRKRSKLWKQAYEFFGPCKSCGDTELKHLTISHIHDDGAEKRKNGEEPKDVMKLIQKFKSLKWPKSLKEDYCLECANCNSGRYSNGLRLNEETECGEIDDLTDIEKI